MNRKNNSYMGVLFGVVTALLMMASSVSADPNASPWKYTSLQIYTWTHWGEPYLYLYYAMDDTYGYAYNGNRANGIEFRSVVTCPNQITTKTGPWTTPSTEFLISQTRGTCANPPWRVRAGVRH